MSKKYFHFTLGPVQSFVAQARRTRDFWAGSFLLSWLSGVAMAAVKQQGGKIIYPQPDADFLAVLQGQPCGRLPVQGCIPNRFMAEIEVEFDPEQVVVTVQMAWRELAELVWEKDFSALPSEVVKEAAREVWQRQVASCWEINWVITPQRRDSGLLNRRKHWRTHIPPEEPGNKCMMMAGLQVLLDERHPGVKYQDVKACQQTLCQQVGSLDLRDGEQLCATGFIKRRFARHFQQFAACINGLALRGWTLPSSVPSLSWIASSHWQASVMASIPDSAPLREAWKTLAEASCHLNGRPDHNVKTGCILQTRQIAGLLPGSYPEDGDSLFEEPLRLQMDQTAGWDAKTTLEALLKVKKLSGQPLAPPFYAVLQMDGDSLGALLRDGEHEQAVSTALKGFTGKVNDTVNAHNGFLIYAGGDDVLALIPVQDAIHCAISLRTAYINAFAEQGLHSTLSGAIDFCHVRQPLTDVLSGSHQLLDDVAKARTGRDALAIRVTQRGGGQQLWTQPWAAMLGELDKEVCTMPDIQTLAKTFAHKLPGGAFTSSFLYRLKALYEKLDWQMLDADGGALRAVIRAELARSGQLPIADDAKASLDTLAQQIYQISICYRRHECPSKDPSIGPQVTFSRVALDNGNALELLLFLAGFERHRYTPSDIETGAVQEVAI